MTNLADLVKIVSMTPTQIEVEIASIDDYRDIGASPRIGSYLQISDGDDADTALIAVVRGFRIKDALPREDLRTLGQNVQQGVTQPKFILSLEPVGTIEQDKFKRGWTEISIPPKLVEIAAQGVLQKIYGTIDESRALHFGCLSHDMSVQVKVDGDRFFGKHIAVVGSTGSGKSSTVAAILQEATRPSNNQVQRSTRNNSHILMFDLHGEYASAFPDARMLTIDDLKLPYWMMNSEELEEIFIESSDNNSYNQVSQFREAVILNKRRHNPDIPHSQISYDSPLYFSLIEVCNYIQNLNEEIIGRLPGEACPILQGKNAGERVKVQHREDVYFNEVCKFVPASTSKNDKATNGPFSGEFNRFLMRLRSRQNDQRLRFLLDPRKTDGQEYFSADASDILSQFLGYGRKESNVTILDLSGIPFEVLSVVVSLVSRLIFTFAFSRKQSIPNAEEIPILLVLEEAHNYIPRSETARYNSVRRAIERIAKEGRKYGVSLMIVSQRPSEISETVFSQCNNFVAMRLTNPADQNYVRRLLPDDIGGLVDSLATLEQREAIILGDAVAMPSIIKVSEIHNRPTSADVNFIQEWRRDWVSVDFSRYA